MRSLQQKQSSLLSSVRSSTKSLNALRNRNIQEEKRPISKNNNISKSYNHVRNISNQIGLQTQFQLDVNLVQPQNQKSISLQCMKMIKMYMIFTENNPNRTSSNFNGDSSNNPQQYQQVYLKGTTSLNPNKFSQPNSKFTATLSRSKNQIQSEFQLHQVIDLKSKKIENLKLESDSRLPKLGPVKANHELDSLNSQQMQQSSEQQNQFSPIKISQKQQQSLLDFQQNQPRQQQQQSIMDDMNSPLLRRKMGDKRLTLSNQALQQISILKQQDVSVQLQDQSNVNGNSSTPKLPVQKQQQKMHHQKSQSLDQKLSTLQSQSLIESIATKTQAGKNPDKSTKTNQDSFICIEQFGPQKQFSLFLVCDGHGIQGHKVSQYVRDFLPIEILLQNISNCNTFPSIKDALITSFKKANTNLHDEGSIDSTFSGTTVILTLLQGSTIYIGNTGDSRAMIGRVNSNNQIQGIGLSNDHKPDLPAEQKRIEQSGGRVKAYIDFDGTPVGPARVWMKDADIPGLAMSRSLGDRVAQQCGVTAEPEVTQYEVQSNDKFMVLASDGVWEFLSNQQVAEMVNPFYQRNSTESAAAKLIKESTLLWKENDEVIDDITCIVVFFQKT